MAPWSPQLDRDSDALILEAVRDVIGNERPLVATLDLHANISPRMVDAAHLLIGYDTYPHVDMAARAEEACERIVQLVNGELLPAAALVKPPMLPTSQRMTTDRSPMRDLIAAAHAWEARTRHDRRDRGRRLSTRRCRGSGIERAGVCG